MNLHFYPFGMSLSFVNLHFHPFEMTRRNLKFRRQASLDSQYPKQGAKILRFQLCVSSVVSIVEL